MSGDNNSSENDDAQRPFKWQWFALGCALIAVACGFAIWGFSVENLEQDQRRILTWILSIASGFSAGAFAGSISIKARGLIPGTAVTATSGFAVWLLCFWFLFPATLEEPNVVLMDSAIRDVVYDPQTRASGGSNADDLTDILKDLPIRLIKETTSLNWRRDQQILEQDPDLIVIHLSCFYDRTNVLDSDERFKSFLRYMLPSRSKFLIYTRGPHGDSTPLEARWNSHLSFLRDFPDERYELFIVPGGTKATFRNPTTGRDIKLKVKSMLEL